MIRKLIMTIVTSSQKLVGGSGYGRLFGDTPSGASPLLYELLYELLFSKEGSFHTCRQVKNSFSLEPVTILYEFSL